MLAADGQASWSVDFWTGDADAAAGMARRLGGTVLAVLSVSKVVPPS